MTDIGPKWIQWPYARIRRELEVAVERDTSRTHNHVSTTDLETLVLEAVDWFIRESLRDELPKRSTAPTLDESLTLTEYSPLAKMLEYNAPETRNREQFLIDLLRDKLTLPAQDTVTYANSRLAPRVAYLEAIVENEDNEFETPAEVVQAAIEAILLPTDTSN